MGSLTPHLDCCPHRMFESDKEIPKWRPIQAFLCLTDTLLPNQVIQKSYHSLSSRLTLRSSINGFIQGGFEASRGLHENFETWVRERKWTNADVPNSISQPPPCVGDFTPIRPKED